ncbi:MAG TPA: DNA-formamidopyrimidine glycosylase family protein [Pirellulales bacterium]|jgi:formamidopyrimidine-DNA glycosylase|nr:DNA-formamidopyrimidine glycosylase family protein [Pirellulales bacterium]
MPELPEVETMRRGLLPLVGRQVAHVERPPCKRRPIAIRPRMDVFRRRVEGKNIVAIDRAGKRVVIWLSKKSESRPAKAGEFDLPGEEAIVIEPRMTGLVLLGNPPTLEHLRFRLQLIEPDGKHLGANGKPPRQAKGRKTASATANELLFWDRRGLGLVSLLAAEEFAAKFQGPDATLGPDALQLTPDQLRERLGNSSRPIKVALLDQHAIAGIGNLYASEILHVAGIHPSARCRRLHGQHWDRLHAAINLVLLEAIQYEGSTLSDGTYRNALNESGGYQHHHRVYDRAGQPCLTCRRGAVRRIVQAQRSTFFCSHCQGR